MRYNFLIKISIPDEIKSQRQTSDSTVWESSLEDAFCAIEQSLSQYYPGRFLNFSGILDAECGNLICSNLQLADAKIESEFSEEIHRAIVKLAHSSGYSMLVYSLNLFLTKDRFNADDKSSLDLSDLGESIYISTRQVTMPQTAHFWDRLRKKAKLGLVKSI